MKKFIYIAPTTPEPISGTYSKIILFQKRMDNKYMDFRMDKLSWGLLVFMFLTFIFYIIRGGTQGAGFGMYLQAILVALFAIIALVAIMCIPVLIYCYFTKIIPDIDYSIRLAAAFTLIGIVSELLF